MSHNLTSMRYRADLVAQKPTCFHNETTARVRELLDRLYIEGKRIRIFYGDRKTGTTWLEEHDIIGRLGRSTGTHPIMILIKNSRSLGGVGILDHCIVGIKDVENHAWLYTDMLFNVPPLLTGHDKIGHDKTSPSELPWYVRELHKPDIIARFKTQKGADNYIDFMHGRRYTVR